MPRRPHSRLPASPPADAAAGAAHIFAAAIKLYDRQDGTGADFRAMTEALFRAAFDALDKLPDDACRSVARRVHEGSYGRMTDGPGAGAGPKKTGIDPKQSPDLDMAGLNPTRPGN